jgi:tetratricopeptide (TPR) repeat protein
MTVNDSDSSPAMNAAGRAVCAIACALLTAILVCGCAGDPRNDAESYLTNLKTFNYAACYETLSHQDKVDRTLEQFLTAIPMAPEVSREWFRPIETKMDYMVGQAVVEGNRAIVPVKVTMPDLTLWERVLDADQNAKEPLDKRAQDSLQENHFPTVSYDDAVVLTKESDGWKVVADFPLKESVAKLHKQAVELYHKRDYDQAIAVYNQALAELEKPPATGNRGLAWRYERERQMIETAKAQLPEAQAYAAKVQLSNVDMKITAAGVPGVFGQITNRGDKPLDEVRLAVTYYTGKGSKRRAIFTEEHTPIDTPIEFSNFNRDVVPLAPNQSRDFGFRLTAPADVQRAAKPEATVSMVVFSQLGSPGATARATGSGTGSSAIPASPPPMPKS